MNGIKRLGLNKINGLGLNNNRADNFQKTLSIKFISANVDDKNKNITFEISASNLSTDKATIYVQEMNYTNESAVPLTNIIINPNGKKNVTVSFSKDKKFDNYFWQSGYSYKATINCDGQSASTEEFSIPDVSKAVSNKGAGIDKNDVNNFPKVKSKALILTDVQKAKFISTVLGETQLGHEKLRDIAWVYFNRLNKHKTFEEALSHSAFYNEKSETYKLFMYYLGSGNEYKDLIMGNGNKISIWANTNYFKTNNVPDIEAMKKFIETEIFSKEPMNPYVGFIGQGFWGDMMRLPPKYNIKWYNARQYYWLQVEGKVSKMFVKKLPDGKPTSYIFAEDSIINFFKVNPQLMPKNLEDIKPMYYEE